MTRAQRISLILPLALGYVAQSLSAQPAPAPPAAQRAAADTPSATTAGTTFTIPTA